MTESEQKVLTLLDGMGVAYERVEHPPVYTCEEAAVYDAGTGAADAKNLFLASADRARFFLVILDATKKLRIRELGRAIGEKGLTFASPEELERVLGLQPGAVSPFGLLNAGVGEVCVILDRAIAESARVSFHPNVNTASLVLETSDFLKVLRQFPNRLDVHEL